MLNNNKIILCYHRVSPFDSGGKSLLSVNSTRFRKQLRLVSKFFNIVTLEEFVSTHECNQVAITFDDGYADNLFHALPVLEELNIKATFFISTLYIQQQHLFLPDLLDRAFSDVANIEKLKNRLSTILSSDELPVDYWGMLNTLVGLDLFRFEVILKLLSDMFREQVLDSDGARRPLTEAELVQLSESDSVTIGAHTFSHRRLSSLSTGDAKNEVDESIRFLKAKFPNKFSTFFAYPFGQPADFNLSIEKYLFRKKFQTLSTDPVGVNEIIKGEALPRLCVQNWKPIKLLMIMQLCIVAARFPKTWKSLRGFRRIFV